MKTVKDIGRSVGEPRSSSGRGPQLEFWFEFASTYSYPAAARIVPRARDAGVEVVWRPFLLGPIFRDAGWDDSPFNLYAAKGRYMWRDLERICADLGLSFRRPSVFPRNGLLAARLACRFQSESWLPEFVRSVYAANFVDDRDIASPEVIAQILDGLGQPSGKLLEDAGSEAAKTALRVQTEKAASLGIFGAPSLLVGEELFWGGDRLGAAIEWAGRS